MVFEQFKVCFFSCKCRTVGWGGGSPYCQKMRGGETPYTCMQPCRHGRMGTDDKRLICGVPTIKQRNRAARTYRENGNRRRRAVSSVARTRSEVETRARRADCYNL
jgi:hypothetical protein